MPQYRWVCHICEVVNEPDADTCMFCSFPAVASGRDILQARASSVPPRPAVPRPLGAHKTQLPLSLGKLVVGVVVLWAVFGFAPVLYIGAPEKAGELGDAFGAVNALFSGLAFAGVIYAIFLQRQDLALQREELSKSSGAGIRQVHIVLQQMAMRDQALQDVWYDDSTLKPAERRQHSYVNLVLSNWETLYANGSLTPEQLKRTAESHMKRRAFRSFWKSARKYREDMANAGNDTAREFHAKVDSAYKLYGEQ